MSDRKRTILNHADTVFLATRIDNFIELVQEPQGCFRRMLDKSYPGSFDRQIIAAAFYLLGVCYCRGKGLKEHPRSKTQMVFLEVLSTVIEAIGKEVNARRHLYPNLSGALGRREAVVELDEIIRGFHLSSDESGES